MYTCVCVCLWLMEGHESFNYVRLKPTYIHTYTHTYIHTYIHTESPEVYCHQPYSEPADMWGIHIHTYIHTHTHTYINTYIHTYIHTYIQNHPKCIVTSHILSLLTCGALVALLMRCLPWICCTKRGTFSCAWGQFACVYVCMYAHACERLSLDRLCVYRHPLVCLMSVIMRVCVYAHARGTCPHVLCMYVPLCLCMYLLLFYECNAEKPTYTYTYILAGSWQRR